ncbi:MAG: hypothetical protein JW384_03568 [Nitrosomonadaceae bacterium]|nr:hypothetical protein [Nitrosomonadaceae bacterium]
MLHLGFERALCKAWGLTSQIQRGVIPLQGYLGVVGLLAEHGGWPPPFQIQQSHCDGQRGQREFRKQVLFTKAAYGPVTVIAWWGSSYSEPIYLVTNVTSVQRAYDWYLKRMHIETFFSDQKSRGFQIDRSHLSEPDRVKRLMFASCLAYLWVIYLGTVAQQDDWLPVIHRLHRCDLSLFQLGLRLLDYLLLHDQPIPNSFALEPESVR